jgi:broad specificity phosphatase PhoE
VTGQRLVLVRHGVTEWNREGRFQGHLDPPLSASGRLEARLVADRLASDAAMRPTKIVTSTLGRARQTAEIIGRATGAPVTLDRRLIEVGQGEWEGRTHAELAVDDAERYTAWRSSLEERQPPGGEPVEAVLERVEGLLDDIIGTPPEGPICLVSHGGTLRLLARRLLTLAAARAWGLDLDNASLSVCSAAGPTGRWRLERWNDTLHLLGRVATHVDEVEGQPLAL